MSGIYKINLRGSSKDYVGSAVNFKKRWSGHRLKLEKGIHPNKKLQTSWIKYGAEAFNFSILEIVEHKGRLIKCEQFWIDLLKPWFNILKTAGSALGRPMPKSAREKIAAFQRGQTRSEATRKAMAKGKIGNTYGRGHVLSQEAKDKLSMAMLGNKRNLGKTLTAETRSKISLAHKAFWARRRKVAMTSVII